MGKTYEVYFEQVNQTRYEIEAESEEEAIKQAKEQWRKENGEARII